jgi:hypothetical protein
MLSGDERQMLREIAGRLDAQTPRYEDPASRAFASRDADALRALADPPDPAGDVVDRVAPPVLDAADKAADAWLKEPGVRELIMMMSEFPHVQRPDIPVGAALDNNRRQKFQDVAHQCFVKGYARAQDDALAALAAMPQRTAEDERAISALRKLVRLKGMKDGGQTYTVAEKEGAWAEARRALEHIGAAKKEAGGE